MSPEERLLKALFEKPTDKLNKAAAQYLAGSLKGMIAHIERTIPFERRLWWLEDILEDLQEQQEYIQGYADLKEEE